MNEYTVTWEIELTAGSPRDAAVKAQRIQRNPATAANVFVVDGEQIDLDDATNRLQFQVNGVDVDANDVRAVIDTEDGHRVVILLGADGCEYYGFDYENGGPVEDIGGFPYGQILDNYHDVRSR